MDFARHLEGVDPQRVVLWGYSFSSGHCVYLAAEDRTVAALLLLCPYLDGLARMRVTPLRAAAWIAPRALMDVAGRHNIIPVTGPPNSHAAMTLPGEEEGFASVVGADSPWRNETSPGVFLTPHTHRPWTKARYLTMPVWVALAEQDVTVPAVGIHRFVQCAPDVQFRRYEADHFGVFAPPLSEQIAEEQTRYLIEKGLLPHG